MNKLWPNKFSLEDKIAVITGGAGLIGEQLCIACGQAGATVIIAENNIELGKRLEEKLYKENIKAECIHMDITSEESLDNSIEYILEKYKKIDIWINNAYPRTSDWGNKFEDIKLDSWRKNVDMHLNGYFICIKKIVEVMKIQMSGSIINFASIYGVVGPTFSIYEETNMTMPAAYSAIKGGIINFTKYMAAYVGKYNIRVNAVCPGGIFDGQDEAFVQKYNEHTPLNRMGLPEEIAGPVVFLASDAASFITGHILMVDGGWTAI